MKTVNPWDEEIPVTRGTTSRDEIDRIEKVARDEFMKAIAAERDHQIAHFGSDIVTEKPVDMMMALLLRSVGDMAVAMSMSPDEASDAETVDEIYRAIVSTGATVSALYEWYRAKLALGMITIERESLKQVDPWMDKADD